MRSAAEWTVLYQDGGSALNDPPRHITDIIREIQREAWDEAACAMLLKLRAYGHIDAIAAVKFGAPEILAAMEGRP